MPPGVSPVSSIELSRRVKLNCVPGINGWLNTFRNCGSDSVTWEANVPTAPPNTEAAVKLLPPPRLMSESDAESLPGYRVSDFSALLVTMAQLPLPADGFVGSLWDSE